MACRLPKFSMGLQQIDGEDIMNAPTMRSQINGTAANGKKSDINEEREMKHTLVKE